MIELSTISSEISKKIMNKINPNWSKIYKIRYIYLELGKHLEKNSDFFLNDKLDKTKISQEEKFNIYNEDKIFISKKLNNFVKYQIICKSASLLLQKILLNFGIESYLIRSTENKDSIYHWFLVVKDDNMEQFFLTISADLPYINNNLPTKHFGNSIHFINENNQQVYVIPDNFNWHLDENGGIVYKVFSCEELRSIDEEINYDVSYELEQFDFESNYNFDYMISILKKSPIYNIYMDSFHIKEDGIKNLSEITEDEINDFKFRINVFIGNILDKKLNVVTNHYTNNYEDFLNVHLILFFEKNGFKFINYNSNVRSLFKENNIEIYDKGLFDDETLTMIRTLFIIEKRFDEYVKAKDNYNNLINEIKEEKKWDNNLNIKYLVRDLRIKNSELNCAYRKIKYQNLIPFFCFLTNYNYMRYLNNFTDKYIPLKYLVDKFCLLFPKIIDCNYLLDEDHGYTNFSLLNYSEQIVIIKDILKKMFSELNYNNSKDMNEYSEKYGPVENRIQTSPFKDRKTGEYCIIFTFCRSKKDVTENDVDYVYIPSKNLLRQSDIMFDSISYLKVSNRFHNKMANLENTVDIDKSL